MSREYLNFNEICQSINFIDVLNWKNIAFTKKGDELKVELNDLKIIINIEKNLFFSPNDETLKGSVINFVSYIDDISLRDAGLELKKQFMITEQKQKEIPNLELEYHEILSEFGIDEELAEDYEIGYVSQRSIMNKRIAFKVYDVDNKVVGYVGWHPEKDHWLFPKNFKRPLYNANRLKDCQTIILCHSLFDCLYLIGIGYTNCASLMGKSMNDIQEKSLSCFEGIILLHPEPENIVQRLCRKSFVKVPIIAFPLRENIEEDTLMF